MQPNRSVDDTPNQRPPTAAVAALTSGDNCVVVESPRAASVVNRRPVNVVDNLSNQRPIASPAGPSISKISSDAHEASKLVRVAIRRLQLKCQNAKCMSSKLLTTNPNRESGIIYVRCNECRSANTNIKEFATCSLQHATEFDEIARLLHIPPATSSSSIKAFFPMITTAISDAAPAVGAGSGKRPATSPTENNGTPKQSRVAFDYQLELDTQRAMYESAQQYNRSETDMESWSTVVKKSAMKKTKKIESENSQTNATTNNDEPNKAKDDDNNNDKSEPYETNSGADNHISGTESIASSVMTSPISPIEVEYELQSASPVLNANNTSNKPEDANRTNDNSNAANTGYGASLGKGVVASNEQKLPPMVIHTLHPIDFSKPHSKQPKRHTAPTETGAQSLLRNKSDNLSEDEFIRHTSKKQTTSDVLVDLTDINDAIKQATSKA
ncbi:UNVERIFIED_CONTAM: hypothetical protein HDU68_006729, partial [Siphonaria sp. JEL0065]